MPHELFNEDECTWSQDCVRVTVQEESQLEVPKQIAWQHSHSISSLILADLALAPDLSGSGLAPSWLPTTATIHCMSPSMAELTAAAVFF